MGESIFVFPLQAKSGLKNNTNTFFWVSVNLSMAGLYSQ